MTAWDIADKLMANFSPIAATILVVAATVIFIIGFSRRGLNFIKYGFGKIALDETLGKRFDRLEERLDSMDIRLDSMDTRIAAIETNHFGHLKNFLTELTGILQDKEIINHAEKARLDNQLRGM